MEKKRSKIELITVRWKLEMSYRGRTVWFFFFFFFYTHRAHFLLDSLNEVLFLYTNFSSLYSFHFYCNLLRLSFSLSLSADHSREQYGLLLIYVIKIKIKMQRKGCAQPASGKSVRVPIYFFSHSFWMLSPMRTK